MDQDQSDEQPVVPRPRYRLEDLLAEHAVQLPTDRSILYDPPVGRELL